MKSKASWGWYKYSEIFSQCPLQAKLYGRAVRNFEGSSFSVSVIGRPEEALRSIRYSVVKGERSRTPKTSV